MVLLLCFPPILHLWSYNLMALYKFIMIMIIIVIRAQM